MELRHLRYFVAVAEEGSLTLAAGKRLHTAQPSLSRQIRDLEREVGATLLLRGPRGVELTPAGQVFLTYARIALAQVEAAGEAARRTAQPPKASLVVGFLTGYEIEWLPALMGILRDDLPMTEITLYSQQSPDLAVDLMRGRIDLAFMRRERETPGLAYQLLRSDTLILVMPADHQLAARASIPIQAIFGETLIGVPGSNAPALRSVTDSYGRQMGIDLTPDHEVLNLSMAISLVASTGGVSLLPDYARNMLPPSVVSRPLQGDAPMIDLVLGYNEANKSPLLRTLLSKIADLKGRAGKQPG